MMKDESLEHSIKTQLVCAIKDAQNILSDFNWQTLDLEVCYISDHLSVIRGEIERRQAAQDAVGGLGK